VLNCSRRSLMGYSREESIRHNAVNTPVRATDRVPGTL
jgi:hypothetical protein